MVVSLTAPVNPREVQINVPRYANATRKVVITMTVPTAVAVRGTAISGAGTLSASLRGVGLLDDQSAAGVVIDGVQISGTALGVAGEVITAGMLLASDADGKLIDVTAAAEHLGFCVALEAAAAEDVLFNVKII